MQHYPCDTTAAAGESNGRRPYLPPPGTNGSVPPDVEALKLAANAEFEAEHYTRSIDLYSAALLRSPAPLPAVLYANRAAALMKRNYSGDVYAALRDCVAALTRSPDHVKAALRLGGGRWID